MSCAVDKEEKVTYSVTSQAHQIYIFKPYKAHEPFKDEG